MEARKWLFNGFVLSTTQKGRISTTANYQPRYISTKFEEFDDSIIASYKTTKYTYIKSTYSRKLIDRRALGEPPSFGYTIVSQNV